MVQLVVVELDLAVQVDEVVGTGEELANVQGRQVAVMVQLLQALLDEINLLTMVDFNDRLIVDLALDLLHAVDVSEGLFLDPVRLVGDQRRDDEPKGQQDVFNDEDGDDKLRPGPLAIHAEPDELLRRENDQEARINDAES